MCCAFSGWSLMFGNVPTDTAHCGVGLFEQNVIYQNKITLSNIRAYYKLRQKYYGLDGFWTGTRGGFLFLNFKNAVFDWPIHFAEVFIKCNISKSSANYM